jgi:hypothetical protein
MIIFVTAAAIFGLDLFWQKVYLRLSTGLDFAVRHPNWPRSLLKLLGLLSSLGFVGLLYWLFPEYHGDFYDRYYQMLRLILPPWLLLALPYIYWVDSHMTQPRDGYWHMGKLLLLQWREVDGKVLGQHLLGWLIKSAIVKYGGSRLYQTLKPLFFGLIAGEIFGAVVPSIVGIAYYVITGMPPRQFWVLPL